MNDLFLVLLTVIITSGLLATGLVILNSRRAGQPEVPWEKIRPILVYVFAKVVDLYGKKDQGYEAMEAFTVDLIYNEIQNTDLFTKEEKDLFTKDLIRMIFQKKLKSLYENDIKEKTLI